MDMERLSRASRQSLRRLLHVTTLSYAAVVATFFFLALAPSLTDPLKPFGALAIVAVGMTAFCVSLGKLATRLGRSWIVWVGLSLLTKPIGPIVACVRMKILVDRATNKVGQTITGGTRETIQHS